jgi:lipoprotein
MKTINRHHLSVCLTSSVLLISSCTHTSKEDSQIANDSIIEEEALVTPLSEININGTWESKDNPFYPALEFKGKTTVVIKSIMGPYPSSYERDEEFIRVHTDKSDLLFEIVSEDSIVGSGFAKGTWVKL